MPEDHISDDPICNEMSEQAELWRQTVNQCLPRAGGEVGGTGTTVMGPGFLCEGQNVLRLDCDDGHTSLLR